jgi:ABC-type uncharacterized transport system substrate-binding protein
MIRQLAMLFLSGAFALLAAAAQADTLNVHLILSDNAPTNQQFASALNKAFSSGKGGVTIIEFQAGILPASGSSKPPDLIITAGMKATETAMANFAAPVLSVMIPRLAYESLLERRFSPNRTKAISAIYMDQPWERQLNFIRAVLPKHNIIGMLYSSRATITLPRLPRGMSINAQSVWSADTLFATLENVLNNSDVLLVIPDSEIYSSSNVRNILLTSYRRKVPLIGISQAYVNAGALGAIFSTPEQIAEQVRKIIISFARDRGLPAPQYPDSFSMGLNHPIAHSLEIQLASPEVIRERMSMEGEVSQ